MFYWATIGRAFTPARTAILGLAAGSGLIAVALQGVEIASGFTPGPSSAAVALTVLSFLTSGPTLAIVLEGREAVAVVRQIMGPTDGTKAPPATIRGDFAISVQNNLIHGSDSPENAEAEIHLWFKPDELVEYLPVDQTWVAGTS